MKNVAVIAHAGKTIGGGLEELRSTLERAGVDEPIWSEVPKSKYAPERVERALDEGAELVFVWGGDGMVQRSIDALAGSGVTLAIIPAGTANLFASSLEHPVGHRGGGRDRPQRPRPEARRRQDQRRAVRRDGRAPASTRT